MSQRIGLILLIIGSFILSACASQNVAPEARPDPSPVQTPGGEALEEPMEEPTPASPTRAAEDAMEDPGEPMGEATPEMMEEMNPTEKGNANDMPQTPDWFQIALTDVNTGEEFRISDYHGQVILVETLAMWCSVCFRQQRQVQALHAELQDTQGLVSIGLDIDPNEVAKDLHAYTQRNGFNWTYAVSPADLSRALASSYGSQFLNPPSAPMLIIDRNGVVHPLRFGLKDAEELKETLLPFLEGEV